jgi:CheY-like chemotaxis protein
MSATLIKPKLMTNQTPTGLKILIVEDHDDCAESTAMFLRLCGHDVVIAKNGPAALEMANISKPEVVLLDIALPGMNGYDVAKHLTDPRPKFTPLIIAISGYPHEYSPKHLEETGIDYHMIKPVKPEELQSILVRFQELLRNSMPA